MIHKKDMSRVRLLWGFRLNNDLYKYFQMILVGAMVLLYSGSSAAQEQWPRDILLPEGKITIFQPQLESFKGDKVTARAAISGQRKDMKEPVFGVAFFSARVVTDRDTRMAEFVDVKVERVGFPDTPPAEEKKIAELIEKSIAKWERTPISLDRLLALTAAIEKEKAEDRISTTPPNVAFRTTPSILIIINGKPVLRDVEGTKMQRVVNTPFVLLFDPATKGYYLQGGGLWFAAPDVMGKYQPVEKPPAAVLEAAKRVSEPQDSSQTQPQAKSKVAPEIIVATDPTELIVTDGEPKFGSVKGTDLLYVTNTENDVFMDAKSQQYYILLAGRWFVSKSLQSGPWAYVTPDKLPVGFYQIPPGSDKQHVLAFVSGTTQAEEAVVDAQIPQTTAIKRDTKLEVTYDGSPKFEKIKGTDIEYAVNTGYQVLRIKGMYYACNEAVWFVSNNPNGPWKVADQIPEKEIQSIPSDSPVYNVKYVRVYESTPEVVYVGYTSGYTGSYIYGGTVVYGTGYVYPGYVGLWVYYPPPITWGFAPVYVPVYGTWGYGWGWSAGFVRGAAWGFAAGAIAGSWWHGGGWHNHGDVNININRQTNINRSTNINREQTRNNIYNKRENVARNAPGTREARPGGTSEGRPGTPTREGRPATPTKEGRPAQQPAGGGARQNDVFAGKDGNVYRKTDKGGWEQRDKSGWSKPESKPQTRDNFERNRSNLERDYSARQRGAERTQNFERSAGGSYGGGSRRGGVSRGGGGGRRR
jgi:hypothetical protein